VNFFPNLPDTNNIEHDPNPGDLFVVYVRKTRLKDLAYIVSYLKGKVTVQPQMLNENNDEFYLTIMIPYGRSCDFTDSLYEEGIRWVEDSKIIHKPYNSRGRS
jgi:hypothetical protein